MDRDIEVKIQDIKDMIEVQDKNLTDGYMVGLYNGLELALCILEEREPKYKENTFING